MLFCVIFLGFKTRIKKNMFEIKTCGIPFLSPRYYAFFLGYVHSLLSYIEAYPALFEQQQNRVNVWVINICFKPCTYFYFFIFDVNVCFLYGERAIEKYTQYVSRYYVAFNANVLILLYLPLFWAKANEFPKIWNYGAIEVKLMSILLAYELETANTQTHFFQHIENLQTYFQFEI